MPTTYWAPNQASIAQVETYTFSAPNSVGNTYNATINGKTLTYSSITGDTAALAATGLYNLLNASTSIAPELTEIQFANPSNGVITATARTPGVPFANVSGTSLGLVLSTGNGLSNGISTVHTTPNSSPSDVNDSQNWLRVIGSAPGVRALPQSGDDVVVNNSSVSMLWNLDQLKAVQFATYTRHTSMTGNIGLGEVNPAGYTEWRATYFWFSGPTGSVPSGGIPLILGYSTTTSGGGGPSRERYNLQSSPYTLTVLQGGGAQDEYGIRILGVHTNNTITLLGGASLGVAMLTGEVSTLASVTVDSGCTLGTGSGVTFSAGSTLTMYGGSALINSAPATMTLTNGAQVTFATTGLTYTSITSQGGCFLNFLCGGTITTLTMTTGCTLDKSSDSRTLTITNSTIDGDSCIINDPLNAVVLTNAITVKQQVSSGPFRFTGSRTLRVT